MKSEFGEVTRNLNHAAVFIEQAVQCGAQVVLLPEFLPSGYSATEEIWNYAEFLSGPSVAWLLSMAKRHGIYLGFTFVESDGLDFYNTFVLSGPNGTLLGQVRKNPPCSTESYYFKAGSDEHFIDTDLGRIGIGICYENLLFKRMRSMHEADVAFILSPAAAGRPISPMPAKNSKARLDARSVFVLSLGVPVIIANIAGAVDTALPENLRRLRIGFPSSSSIVDGDGIIMAEGGNGEGIIVGAIRLKGASDRRARPKRFGLMWAVPVPRHALMWWVIQKIGERSYSRNSRRKACARALCADADALQSIAEHCRELADANRLQDAE